MALKQATTNVEYIKWSEIEPGSVLKGFYIETKPSNKPGYAPTIYIETVEGRRFGMSASANLERALEQVREGWYIELKYEGMIVLESGNFKGSNCHQFSLAYDDERIHPLFSGDASARQEVTYKNSDAEEQPTPALVKPEPAQAAPAATGETPKKRNIF